MSQADDKTRFITFYSYKGGVGRTMALANVACQLANLHGKHVICVDWDLEAPGLHYYFKFTDEDLVTRAGLLDYLLDFKWQYEQGAKGQEPNIGDYLMELKPKQRDKIKHGSVRLLHCGQTGPNYMARVQAFDWDEYYEKYEGFRIIETLKKQLLDCDADMILVDARAGQADVGATPTIQVPDAVVLLFTSNTQNLEGTAKIARDLSQHRMRKQLEKPLKLLMVPARVFPREESFQRWLEEYAVPVFDKLVEDDVVSLRDQPKRLAQCMIPIDAKWAVPERLPILEAPTAAGDQRTPEINQAYMTLAQAIENLYQGREAWSAAPSTLDELLTDKPPDEAAEALRQLIPETAARGDDQAVARLQFKLAQVCIGLLRFDEAETNLQAAVAYAERVKDKQAVAVITHSIGLVRAKQKKFSEAWSLFEKALALGQEAGALREQGVTLNEMGRLRAEQKDFPEAWSLLEKALALKEETGDARGQGVTLHEMGCVREEQKEFPEAWALFEKALTLKEEAGDAREQGVTLHEMGHLRAEQKRFPEAWSLFEKALALSEEANDPREQGVTLNEMGHLHAMQNEFPEALSLFEKALELLGQAGEARGQCVALHEMGKLKLVIGELAPARQILQRGLAMAEANGIEEGVEHFREELAEVEAREKDDSDKTSSATKPAKKRKKKAARSSKKKP